MMEENPKAKRKKPREPLYNNEEFMVLLEMMKGGKANLKSKARQMSRYMTHASIAKSSGEPAMIFALLI